VDWCPVPKPGEFCELQRLTRSHQTFAPSNRFVSECRKPSPPLSEPLHHQQLRFERPKKSFHAEETGCIGSDNNSSSGQPMALSRDHQSCQLQRFDQQQRQKYQDEGLIRTELLNADEYLIKQSSVFAAGLAVTWASYLKERRSAFADTCSR